MPNTRTIPGLMLHLPLAVLLGLLVDLRSMAEEGSVVQAVRTKQGWTLQKNGLPYDVFGVGGGESDLARLRDSGVTTIRTWGIDASTIDLLDAAHDHGLMVMVGLWMGHVGDGFDYLDPDEVAAQEANLLALAAPLKEHPALFGWGIGNEVEFGHDVPEVWQAIGSLASAIKAMDPNHPTVAVTAEIGTANEQRLAEYCPDIDVWGINAYGGLPTLPDRLTARGWTGPYLITEYAHQGDWERETTGWGAPLEPSSREKALAYQEHWETVISTDSRCLGGFAFVWRSGRSPTDTWFPMLTWDGRGTEATDRMRSVFTGAPPSNLAPTVGGIIGDVAGRVFSPGESLIANVAAIDPEGEPLSVEWFLARETLDAKGQWVGTSSASLCLEGNDTTLTTSAPMDVGAYRLFVFVGDAGPSVGTASAPFLVDAAPTGYDATPTFAVADHFFPTGWMGDTGGLRLTDCIGPQETCGGVCARLDWTPSSANWFGILWQYPPNNWGDMPGLAIAPGAASIGFYAWSTPPSTATFRVGADHDGLLIERTLSLETTPRWFELEIDPQGYDRVSTGFGIITAGSSPRTIWISDMSWIAIAPSSCVGDIDVDGFIGSSDLGLLLAAWGDAKTHPSADLNRDGTIDSADLGLLAARWGACPKG